MRHPDQDRRDVRCEQKDADVLVEKRAPTGAFFVLPAISVPEGDGILNLFLLEAVTEAEADIHFELYTFCPHAILVRDERTVKVSQTGG